MPFIHLILSIFITACFVVLVFLLSWYIALPLLIIWVLGTFIRWVRLQIQARRFRRESNGCTLHPTDEHAPAATIIDADYTEIS